jgi:MFS family permease
MAAYQKFKKDIQYYRFCAYGFLKNLRFFEPFLLLFFLDNGLSYFEIGILYSVLEIVRNLLEIPSGFVSDMLGRRRTMVASFATYIVAFVIFYSASSFSWFLIAIIFFAFADAFRTGTHKAMIFAYLKLHSWEHLKADYYGRTRAWSQTGSAISALIAGAVIFFEGNYRTVFLYTTIPYVVDMINVATYPKQLEGSSGESSSLKASFRRVWQGLVVSFRKVLIIKTLANTSSHSGYFKAVKDYLQPLVKSLALTVPLLGTYSEEQRSAVFIGVIYFTVYLITSQASRYAGTFRQLFSSYSAPLNATMIAGFTIGVAGGIFFELDILWVAVALFMGIFIIENLRKPIGIAYISDKLEDQTMATALSVESQAKSLFAALIAPLLGYFADSYGLGYGLALASVLLLIVAPLFLARKTKR